MTDSGSTGGMKRVSFSLAISYVRYESGNSHPLR
jgi:hypothetical protein